MTALSSVSRAVAPLRGNDRVAFFSCVAFGPGCWEWTDVRNEAGYGLTVLGCAEGMSGYASLQLAHRVAYATSREEIVPAGLLICHECDNPPCVRGSHLFRGTVVDNNLDRDEKLRTAHGEGFDHAVLTVAQVREAVTLHAAGASVVDLAARYGVHRRTLRDALTGRTWARERGRVLLRLAIDAPGGFS